jgi:hypothetical protein
MNIEHRHGTTTSSTPMTEKSSILSRIHQGWFDPKADPLLVTRTELLYRGTEEIRRLELSAAGVLYEWHCGRKDLYDS